MDNHFCVECLEEAIERYGKPDILTAIKERSLPARHLRMY